jgi:lysophospholipase L1-like esterase
MGWHNRLILGALCMGLVMILLITTPLAHSSTLWNSIGNFFSRNASAPELIHPADGARYTAGDPIVWFEFSTVPEADYYEISYSFTADFSTSFTLETSSTLLEFADFLTPEDWDPLSLQLYWQVRAHMGPSEWSDWSSSREFAKSQAAAVVLLTPGKDARFGVNDPMPVLSWEPQESVSSYAIEFAEDAAFTTSYGWFRMNGTVLDFSSGDPEAWNPVVGTFYWRVWGLESGDVPAPYSEPSYFSKTIIGKPVLTEPANHTRMQAEDTVPILRWEPVSGAIEYHVQLVYSETPFSDGLNYISFTETAFDFADFEVTQAIWNEFYGELGWRVAAVDSEGHHGSFSLPFEFVKIANHRYMAYGDSITGGYGSDTWGTGFAGYPRILQGYLRNEYGNQVNVLCQENYSWFPGGHAYTGDWEMEKALKYHAPSVVMIMFGTVDAVDPGAPGCDNFDCHVKEHISNMVQQARSFHAEPFFATLPPVNPDSERAWVQADIDMLNMDIRDLAAEMSIPLIDIEHAFYTAPFTLPTYYYEGDWAHFNELGYTLMADTWFEML